LLGIQKAIVGQIWACRRYFKMNNEDLLKQEQDEELKKVFKDIDLEEDEIKYLNWLWKWDFETKSVFLSIFKKLKNYSDKIH
jgi:hypothetical protein